MAARRRMTVVKTAVLSLLRDAYQRRDRIGMITFRGADAEEVLAPTSSHDVGVARLASVRTGGRTPIAAGLAGTAAVVLDCESGPVRLGLARRLADALDAECVPLDALGVA
jgi:magnesium chelatase subunit D